MLGNLIGGFIVILVGTTLNTNLVLMGEIPSETAEFRLISSDGQDRSVKHLNYARTTDKAYFTFTNSNESKIYSLDSNDNQNIKLEITYEPQQSLNRWEQHNLMVT